MHCRINVNKCDYGAPYGHNQKQVNTRAMKTFVLASYFSTVCAFKRSSALVLTGTHPSCPYITDFFFADSGYTLCYGMMLDATENGYNKGDHGNASTQPKNTMNVRFVVVSISNFCDGNKWRTFADR